MSRDSAAASTFEAVAYALREGGAAALSINTHRLEQLSERQLEDLISRLHREKQKYRYPAITDDLIQSLTELLP
jgi:hypothetical protein